MNINIEKLISSVEKTGSYDGEIPEYRLLRLGDVLSFSIEENYWELVDIFDEIEENLDGYVSALLVSRVRKENDLKLIHVSDVENVESIKDEGLKLPKNNNIPNLGKGVYCIRNMNYTKYTNKEYFGCDGHTNLREWVKDYCESFSCDGISEEVLKSTEIAVVEFVYSGEYEECIYGTDHTGYIVIKNDISSKNIDSISKMSVFEFLEKY